MKLCKDCAHFRRNYSFAIPKNQIRHGNCAFVAVVDPTGAEDIEYKHSAWVERQPDFDCGPVARNFEAAPEQPAPGTITFIEPPKSRPWWKLWGRA